MVKLSSKSKKQYMKIILDTLNNGDRNEFRKNFLKLHPSDQQDLYSTLPDPLRHVLYSFISPDEFANIFEGLTTQKQKTFLAEVEEYYSSMVFNHLFTDDVVQFLNEIEPENVEHLLDKMDQEKAEAVRILLSYKEETAGAIMTKEFISIASSDTALAVIQHLREAALSAEIIYYNYVIDDEGTLVGVVSLRDLITADPDEKIESIMSSHVVYVEDDLDQEEVAQVIQKYDILAVPVVSKSQKLLGIVTVDDIMDIVEDETTEDFGEISAAKGATDIDLSSFAAAKKRSPWIIALMFFGLVTAGIIGRFEDTLEQVVLLAVFIPLIMDSAGNTGTQSLAVAVRGLALGTINKKSIGRMLRREFGTGVLLGLICMALLSGLIGLLYGNWFLAFIVGFSIFCTLSVSTVIGATVPLIINKLNLDPAIASGPFITTVNDIIGLMIYFSVATAFMDIL